MKRKPALQRDSSQRMALYERLCKSVSTRSLREEGTPFLIDIAAHGSVVTVCSPEYSHELDRLGSALCFIMPNALETSIRRRRDQRQQEIYRWVSETFGPENINITERVLRLAEEVIELAQAERVAPERLRKLVDYVYSRQAGKAEQEAGGIGTTLLAYCAAKGISADDVEAAEAERVLKIDADYFRQRHNIKAEAGVAAFVKDGAK